MKTKIQSLFMALLLVFAVVPTSVLAQVDLETEATIMKNVEADIINLFIKYSYDVDDIEDYIANTKDEEVAKLMKEYGQRAEEALAEGDEEKLVQSVEYLLSTFDQIITAKYGAEGSRQLMDKYTQYRTKPDYTQYKIKPDMRGKEPGTFWLYPGDQMAFKELESTLVLTYLGSSQNPSQKPTQVACTEELKLCPDGTTYVGRDSNRNCAWNACPGEGSNFVSTVSDILAEGAEKTYVLEGDMAFIVEVMIIEDTEPATVTFKVNGEVTEPLSPGKSTLLKTGGATLLVHNIALRSTSGNDLVKFTLSISNVAVVGDVVADKGVCEQFSITFSPPAVLNKPRFNEKTDAFKEDNEGFYNNEGLYKKDYGMLVKTFRANYERAVAEGDEAKIIEVKRAFERDVQTLAKKYGMPPPSVDVAAYLEQKETIEARMMRNVEADAINIFNKYSYDPDAIENYVAANPEDKEVAKLLKEYGQKANEAVAEGDEEKFIRSLEDLYRKFDERIIAQYGFEGSRQLMAKYTYKQSAVTKPMPPVPPNPMLPETKTFCILPGEVGYPIMLYEKKADGAVLVGYNAWKEKEPFYSKPPRSTSSYVATSGQVRQTSYGFPQEKDSCQVEGNGAVSVGIRLNFEGKSQYCDALTKKMMVQKQDGEQAENAYECLSNEQNNGQCVNSLNILQKIWKGITSIFGF